MGFSMETKEALDRIVNHLLDYVDSRNISDLSSQALDMFVLSLGPAAYANVTDATKARVFDALRRVYDQRDKLKLQRAARTYLEAAFQSSEA